MSLGVIFGLIIAFYCLRYLFQKKIQNWINNSEMFTTVVKEIENNHIKSSLLTRFMPIPIGVQTMILSISSIPVSTYTWTGIVSQVPQQLVPVYMGANFRSLNDVLSGNTEWNTEQYILFIIQITLTAVAIFLLGVIGRKTFKRIARKRKELNKIVLKEEKTEISDAEIKQTKKLETSNQRRKLIKKETTFSLLATSFLSFQDIDISKLYEEQEEVIIQPEESTESDNEYVFSELTPEEKV